MSGKALKVLGLVTAFASFGISMLSNWVSDKKLDNEIEEKVNEALAEAMKEKKKGS